MPSNITMAPHSGAKLLPMLPATAKPRPPTSLLPSSLTTASASTLHQLVASSPSSSSSTTVLSKSLLATATSTPSSSTSPSSANSVSTISIPVSAFHDPNSNVITITPYIFVKTATVAEQMQALRQDKKLPKQSDSAGTTGGALRVKRRADISSKLGLPDAKPASVSRRNARERNRVKQVNLGFETLREHVPNGKKNKKMSKVQTLRSAAQYIKDLYMILHGELPELGSPADIDETEPASPLDNSMCSVSDTDDFNAASPEQQQQQQQVQLSQKSEQLLLQQQQQQQQQQQEEDMMQQEDQDDQMLQEQEKQLLHRPQQLLERQLIRMQQQQDNENQQPQAQLFNRTQQMFQTQNLLNAQESMETSDSSIIVPSSLSSNSSKFQDNKQPRDTEMQVELSHQTLQRQLQARQQQQFSQLQPQKELQQKLLRQHQEQQRKKQLLQLHKEEIQQQQQQQQQQQLERQQQEKRQNVSKSQTRPQKQRSAQIRQKQQPLILKKESVSVLQQQLNRGNISQLQRLQAHLQEQSQLQQQQQLPSPPPSLQQQPIHNDQQKQQLQQQVSLDPSVLRTEAMTCTSTNFGFSRSASTSSDGQQLPDTPLSAFAASRNVSANSPIPGSPLVFGARRSTGTGDSPLPGTPVTFTELSPVSLEDDQCENYMGLPNTGPPFSNSLQTQQLQNTISDFVGVDQSGGIQQFSLNTSGQNLSHGCADSNLTEIPTSPSMLQPATYVNDSNMNIITSSPPNPSDFEALHSYYKAIHTEHFIKNMDDDVFVLEPRNVINNSIVNSNNNNPETANNNIHNTSNHSNSISSNNSSIAAILNNTSNIVNTLLSNNNSMNNFGNYLNAKNNNTINSKLTHSPAPSLDSNSSMTSSDVDLTITGNSVCYNSRNINNNNNSDSCYEDNGVNDLETYENLDGDALQDISNWISELCSQGMHGADIGQIQQMTMAYSH